MAICATMLAVAATPRSLFRGSMPPEAPKPTKYEQAIAIGAALKSLRERGGMTQEQAGEAMGVTRQAWQQYETAGKPILLRTDMQEELASALGLSRHDLLRERDRLAGVVADPGEPYGGMQESARIYELPVLGRVRTGPDGPMVYDLAAPEGVVNLAWLFGETVRSLRVAGEAMTGYVESGQLVIYDTSLWPRRGEGCVVELSNGEVHVAEYESVAQGVLKVRQRFPEETLSFPMANVKGVYQIRFRGG